MDGQVRFGKFTPDGMSRPSAMLLHGRLTATITSKATRAHVTLRLRCKDKERGWEVVPFEEASHVFIEDFDGDRIATYYPRAGALYYADRASGAARWSVQALLTYLAGANPRFEEQAELDAADECGKCGKELTDPVSIDRGFGSDCFGMITGSRHASMWTQHAAMN